MFGFRPRLPITEEDRKWVNHGFDRLSLALGRNRMIDSEVILPTVEYFPDKYDGTEETLEALFG